MSISDVAAQLGAVLVKIDAVRESLSTAAALIDDATGIMGAAVSGTAAPDALQALALFGEAQRALRPPFLALRATEDAIRTYLAHLGATTATRSVAGVPSSRGDRPPAAQPAEPVAVTSERIEQPRRELPPSVVVSTGQKTHGRWIDPDGNVHPEVSGVGALDVYYLFEHEDSPVVLSTVDEVDALIDRVRAESPQAAPILMDVHMSGDPYAQGLDVGVASDHGVIRYSGREWPRGVVSSGGGPADGEARPYFYMGHWREFPANAEIPLDVIRQAVKDFMTTDGARPTCVQWQPAP